MKDGLRDKKSIRKLWYEHQWAIVAACAATVMGIGFIGFSAHFDRLGEKRSFWDIFYLTIQLFVLESGSVPVSGNFPLNLARLMAPAISAYTALLAFLELFSEQLTALRLKNLSGHSVVFGLNQISFFLIASLVRDGKKVVVVESDKNNTYIPSCFEMGAVIVIGNAEEPETLLKASVNSSEKLYCMGDDDNMNAEIANNAGALLSETAGRPVECVVNINDPFRCLKLTENEIIRDKKDRVRYEYFNLYSASSSWLVSEYDAFAAGKNTGGRPCLLIAGGGNMAESILVSLARKWGAAQGRQPGKFTVALMNENAGNEAEKLLLQYPALTDYCDIDTIQTGLDSNEFKKISFLSRADGKKKFDVIYICDTDDSKNMAAAFSLVTPVNELKITTFACFSHLPGLIKLYTRNDLRNYRHLLTLELAEKSQIPEMIKRGVRETLARAIHRDYIEKSVTAGQQPPVPVFWNDLSNEIKESNRSQADHIFVKLGDIECSIAPLFEKIPEKFEFTKDEIETLAVFEHERWNEEKIRNGWVFGEKRDEKNKTTPYLVSYDRLPENIKQYDRDAVVRIPELLETAGFRVVRRSDARSS